MIVEKNKNKQNYVYGSTFSSEFKRHDSMIVIIFTFITHSPGREMKTYL